MSDAEIPKTTDVQRDLDGRLMDEYKILQDKIDKIGAFRFTIKGWSVTVIIASIVAGSTTKAVPRWLWALSLVGFLVVFFFTEKQQTDLRHRFGQRVLAIELVLSRLLRKLARDSGPSVAASFLTLRYVPGIGHGSGARIRRKDWRPRPRTYWRSCIEADIGFYIVQLVVVLAFVFWPGRPVAPDHNDSILINNALPAGNTVNQDNPENVQPAQTCSGRKNTSPVGKNEKDRKTKKEYQSH